MLDGLESLRADFLGRQHCEQGSRGAWARVREDEAWLPEGGGCPRGAFPPPSRFLRGEPPSSASRPSLHETALVQRPTLTSNSGKSWEFAIGAFPADFTRSGVPESRFP